MNADASTSKVSNAQKDNMDIRIQKAMQQLPALWHSHSSLGAPFQYPFALVKLPVFLLNKLAILESKLCASNAPQAP